MIKVYKKPETTVINDVFGDCYVSYTATGDVDVTDYKKLKEFYRVNQIDYTSFRNTLKSFVFNDLTEEDKINLVSEFVAPSYEVMLQFKTEEELKLIYAKMIELEKNSRVKRYEAVTYEAGFALKESQMSRFMAYNDIKQYKLDYVEVEFPALLAFVSSAVIPELGIDFSNTGFSSKSYYSEALKNKIIDILTR